MLRRLTVILLVLSLATCSVPRGAADPLRTARQHIEASRCAGVDRYAQAVADLEAALSADPHQVEAYYWLFVAHRARGDSSAAERARAALEEAVAAGRGGPAGRFWLLRLYREAGDGEAVQRTLSVMESVAEATPSDVEARYWLGRAYYETGQADLAVQSFQRVLELKSDHGLAHFWLGQIYAEQGQLEEARRELDAALPHLTEKAAAYHNRGVVAYQLGDLEAAVSDLQAALKEDPEDPRSHYQLGAVYLAQAIPANPLALPDSARLENAQEEFTRALQLCPGMPEALIGMGNLHLLQGDAQKALEVLNQVLEREPDSLQAWYAVAQAQATLGHPEEACRALDQFLSLSPPAEWAEQAGKMKGQLGCP